MDARMHLFVVGSQCAERSGAPRAHPARCGGLAWGWCLARWTAAGTATPLRTVPGPDLPAQVGFFGMVQRFTVQGFTVGRIYACIRV